MTGAVKGCASVILGFFLAASACDSAPGEGGNLFGGNNGAAVPGNGGATPTNTPTSGPDTRIHSGWLFNRGNGGIALRFRSNGTFEERRYVMLANGAVGVEDYTGTYQAMDGTLNRTINTSTCAQVAVPENKTNMYNIINDKLTIGSAVYVKTGFTNFTNMMPGCVSTTNGTFTPR